MGTIAAGRIGYAVMKRLYPFDVNLHYTEKHRLPAEKEQVNSLIRAEAVDRSIDQSLTASSVSLLLSPLFPNRVRTRRL